MQIIDGIPVWGNPEQGALDQIKTCARTADHVALMADSHKGYAVPIGGVVAYRDSISPSGVGYDIACIAEGSPITLADGARVPIECTADRELIGARELPSMLWADTFELCNVGPPTGRKISTRPTTMLTVSSGDQVCLTDDHEVLTPDGWCPVADTKDGDEIAVSPFIGIDSATVCEPTDAVFMRLLGYVMGDGHLTKRKFRTSVYTSRDEDVASIIAAFAALGKQAKFHRRVKPNTIENHIYCDDQELHTHLAAAGCPVGKKRWHRALLEWILVMPYHLQTAWLSGLFGAEMLTPRMLSKSLPSPAMKQGGYDPLNLLNVVSLCLAGLGFESDITPSGKPIQSQSGAKQAYVLIVGGGQLEFVRLWRTVGFAYCAKKRAAAARMMSIVWQCGELERTQTAIRNTCRDLYQQGVLTHFVHQHASKVLGRTITKSVAHKAIYEERLPNAVGRRRVQPRVAGDIVWARIIKRESSGERRVHDIPLSHPAHNFVASGVMVHNCGNKAVRTDAVAAEVRQNIAKIMDGIWSTISFGVGRKNDTGRVDHELFDDVAWKVPFVSPLKELARSQLGTVGSGNHYVDIFVDEEDRVWIGVHFGSRGLGHKTATAFLKAAGAKDGMDVEPCVISATSDLGAEYLEAMRLSGLYAYAGRDWVCQQAARVLGANILEEIHNHHNFAWRETHNGHDMWVVRKGATPAFPGQKGFVGGSMGDVSVIIEGVENEQASQSLYSTVHGAGRVMGRMQAKGKFDRKTGVCLRPGLVTRESMDEWVRKAGVTLRGAGVDESPHVYKRLPQVLAEHGTSIKILHTLRPIGVAMAGENELDPYKD